MTDAPPPGPVLLDLAGELTLAPDDRERLVHPAVGGVILFARNYADRAQLLELVGEIRRLRPELLVAVDQEGGRVQRFRSEFARLPCAARYGELYDLDPERGLAGARAAGFLMAAQLRECDIDISFAPVLDLALVGSAVIGDRAFHRDPGVVTELARAWIAGMRVAGMAATGKHFPGHGGVTGDSHHCLPCDHRAFGELREQDLVPYRRLSADLAAVMTAHVLFDAVDGDVPTYSRYWLREVLRGDVGFEGIVFSDDLAMQGAHCGAPDVRARKALDAGCDVVLMCNDLAGAEAMLEAGLPALDHARQARFVALKGAGGAEPRSMVAAQSQLHELGLLSADAEPRVG